jgi:hypothetical protein
VAGRGASSVFRRPKPRLTTTVATTSKRAALAWCASRLPMDHFKKLFEETCPNHTYPIKNKLRGCDMMKNLMALGSLTQGMEVDEVPNDSDTTPLPEKMRS